MNTIAQGSAAFFLMAFVFLEKMPILNCLSIDNKWEVCQPEKYCLLEI